MDETYISRWSIYDIGTLDQVGFSTQISELETDTMTIMFWYRATEAIHRQVILGIDALTEIVIENKTLRFEFYDHNIATVSLDLPELDSWHHVALSIGTNLTIYIDAQLIYNNRLSVELSPNKSSMLQVGGYTDPAGGHFDYTFGRNQTGWVDDIRLYDQAVAIKTLLKFRPADTNKLSLSIEHKQLSDNTFQFEMKTDDSTKIQFCLWDFGDSKTGIGQRVKHTYSFAGEYTVRLTVVSKRYQQTQHEHTITVLHKSTALEKNLVFQNGKEGHACYRIPSIVRAKNGDLVAFAEARLENCSDATHTVRLVCKRSTDNGKTWLPLQIVARNLIDGDEFAVQQNAPVVDSVHNTGRIVVLYNKLENSEFEIADGIGQSRIFCIFSDDHGKSWYGEKDISSEVHRSGQWRVQRPTLGHAIQLRSGRLLFAGMLTDGERSVFESQNYLFWSDDLGQTWSMSEIIPHIGLNEATAVELENGDIMINSRAYQCGKPVGKRAVTIARFAPDNNVKFETTYFDDGLPDPTIQASIIRYSSSDQVEYGSKSRLLFTNPNNPNARYNLSVRLSYDDGKTWACRKTIEVGPSAYSDLVIQDNMQIGVLYERGNQGGIVYTNFTLDWLTDGKDTIESKL